MNYQSFAAAVEAAGLEPRCCNEIHWQILGGKFVVNFYPHTKRGERFYVDRAQHGTCGPLERALRAAKGEITFPMRKTPKRRQDRGSDIPGYIQGRWQQHKHSGGKLTLEQFHKRSMDRERRRNADMRGIDVETRRNLAESIYGDLPDGAFLAASEESFGLQAEDWE